MNKILVLLGLIFSFTLLGCKDNGVNIDPFGQRGEVTGTWSPLLEGDTLEVYVHLENNIHLGDPGFEITIIPEAYPSTFQVWTDSQYARDSVHVYFPIEISCVVIEEQTVCYSTNYIVENAVAANFRYLGNGYGTDGNELYQNGVIVQGNNGEGF